ncbi:MULTISPECIES: tetratricopeptide repeat protein [Chitinophagaceae]
MKKIFLIGVSLFALTQTYAQSAEADSKNIMDNLKQAGFDKSIESLDASLRTYPDNFLLLKDKVLLNYLNRNFNNAISIGKPLLDRSDADEQIYVLVGSSYAAIADTKEASRVYKKGLAKFPKSALLYSNYGAVLESTGDLKEAIGVYEKGIQADPNVSGNYYSLAKLYAQNDNPLWSAIYGEMFVNLESLSQRTKEIKSLLFNQYKVLFAIKGNLDKYVNNGKPFEKAVATTYTKYKSILSAGITTESLIALRGQFIVEWFQSELYKQFPFRLFDRERQLLKQGNFDAYNQWLFSASNEAAYNNWAASNSDDLKAFENYHRSVVFKPSPNEYYAH